MTGIRSAPNPFTSLRRQLDQKFPRLDLATDGGGDLGDPAGTLGVASSPLAPARESGSAQIRADRGPIVPAWSNRRAWSLVESTSGLNHSERTTGQIDEGCC